MSNKIVLLLSLLSSPPLVLCCARCDKDRCTAADLTRLDLCSYCPQQRYAVKAYETRTSETWCTCESDHAANTSNSLTCYNTLKLDAVFDLMVNQLHHQYRYFRKIEVQNCNSDTIETNFFSGLRFRTVQFTECRNLKTFSPQAFSSTTDFLETLNLELYSSSADIWSNVFRAIRHLSVLNRLQLTGFEGLIIPSKAFRSVTSSPLSLTVIHFNVGGEH